MLNKILVIGAQNIDIFAKTNDDYKLRDSNIASIHLSYGGVGRNIVENLTRLENKVSFLTVFSNDEFGKQAKNSLIELGVTLDNSLYLDNTTNSIYLGVLDKDNDLFLGLNDMDIVESISPKYLQDNYEYINQFEVLVIDNNLTKEAITYILKTFKATKVMDAVSAHKVDKLKGVLKYIDVLKVNEIELNELAIGNTKEERIDYLINQGLNKVIVTSSEHEIVLKHGSKAIYDTPFKVDKMVNASGAGDAFISGYIHGLINNYDDLKRLHYAKCVAYYTLMSNDATNKNLSLKEAENVKLY